MIRTKEEWDKVKLRRTTYHFGYKNGCIDSWSISLTIIFCLGMVILFLACK